MNGIDMELDKETTHDTAFLMEQLEMREQLAEAKDQPDPFAVLDELMGHLDTVPLCRGAEPVQYVREIRSRYEAYLDMLAREEDH